MNVIPRNHLSSLLSILAVTSAFCYAYEASAKQIVVAVIDTGIDQSLRDSSFICKSGHKDFTGTGIIDHHSHGTHISMLIHQYATGEILDGIKEKDALLKAKADYCQVILKFHDPMQLKPDSLQQELSAWQQAIDLKVDVINFSGGGTEFSAREAKLVKQALDMGIKVVVSAGNEHSHLDKSPYYPAVLDSRIIVVGNLNTDLVRAPSSNYGPQVDDWEVGTSVKSLGLGGRTAYMTGTSQAAAIKSGKIVRQMLSH